MTDGMEEEEKCSICLFGLKENNTELRTLDCTHTFHKLCVDRWLETSNTCPVCRFAFRTSPDEVARDTIDSLIEFLGNWDDSSDWTWSFSGNSLDSSDFSDTIFDVDESDSTGSFWGITTDEDETSSASASGTDSSDDDTYIPGSSLPDSWEFQSFFTAEEFSSDSEDSSAIIAEAPQRESRPLRRQQRGGRAASGSNGPSVTTRRSATSSSNEPSITTRGRAALNSNGPSVTTRGRAALNSNGPSVTTRRRATSSSNEPSITTRGGAALNSNGPSVTTRGRATLNSNGPSVTTRGRAALNSNGPSVTTRGRATSSSNEPSVTTRGRAALNSNGPSVTTRGRATLNSNGPSVTTRRRAALNSNGPSVTTRGRATLGSNGPSRATRGRRGTRSRSRISAARRTNRQSGRDGQGLEAGRDALRMQHVGHGIRIRQQPRNETTEEIVNQLRERLLRNVREDGSINSQWMQDVGVVLSRMVPLVRINHPSFDAPPDSMETDDNHRNHSEGPENRNIESEVETARRSGRRNRASSRRVNLQENASRRSSRNARSESVGVEPRMGSRHTWIHHAMPFGEMYVIRHSRREDSSLSAQSGGQSASSAQSTSAARSRSRSQTRVPLRNQTPGPTDAQPSAAREEPEHVGVRTRNQRVAGGGESASVASQSGSVPLASGSTEHGVSSPAGTRRQRAAGRNRASLSRTTSTRSGLQSSEATENHDLPFVVHIRGQGGVGHNAASLVVSSPTSVLLSSPPREAQNPSRAVGRRRQRAAEGPEVSISVVDPSRTSSVLQPSLPGDNFESSRVVSGWRPRTARLRGASSAVNPPTSPPQSSTPRENQNLPVAMRTRSRRAAGLGTMSFPVANSPTSFGRQQFAGHNRTSSVAIPHTSGPQFSTPREDFNPPLAVRTRRQGALDLNGTSSRAVLPPSDQTPVEPAAEEADGFHERQRSRDIQLRSQRSVCRNRPVSEVPLNDGVPLPSQPVLGRTRRNKQRRP